MTIVVKHHLEPYELLRLEALARRMTEQEVAYWKANSKEPGKPYTVRTLLTIYGFSGCADLFREKCAAEYGVRGYYSPEGDADRRAEERRRIEKVALRRVRYGLVPEGLKKVAEDCLDGQGR